MKDEILKLLNDIKSRWNNLQNLKSGWLNTSSKFSLAVPFLLKALDELMVFMNRFEMPGTAKKSVVMEAASDLYDYIIGPILPFWIRPFSSKIKDLVINVLVSEFIDFLIAKINKLNTGVSNG